MVQPTETEFNTTNQLCKCSKVKVEDKYFCIRETYVFKWLRVIIIMFLQTNTALISL